MFISEFAQLYSKQLHGKKIVTQSCVFKLYTDFQFQFTKQKNSYKHRREVLGSNVH